MKILQIGATFVGAQKKIEYAIHQYCKEQGHDSRILYAIGESNDPDVVNYENKLFNFIRRGLRKFLGKKSRFAILSTLSLIKKIKAYNPDLVHIHVIHHGYLYYEMLLEFLATKKIPTVFTAHDMWFFTGGCYYYSVVGCDGFLKECKNCPKSTDELDCPKSATTRCLKKKLNLFSRFERLSFVSVSPWVCTEMKKSQLSKYPQYVVMNSVDNVAYVPFRTKKNEKFTIIGVAASWDERKGLKRFFELADILGDKCDIVLVGAVNSDLKSSAPENITLYGYTKNVDELYDLYSKSDLHVSLSFEETFGLTFVEAALSGIKSLGYNSTAIPGVLEKTHGFIIDNHTVAAVASKIEGLVCNRELCVVTKEEYEDIKRYFSVDRMSAEYLEVYNETLSSSREK